MIDFNEWIVASRLLPGQRSVVRDLTSEACMIGCGEDCARRLSVANSQRPALTFRGPGDGGIQSFGLTAEGLRVQALLGSEVRP